MTQTEMFGKSELDDANLVLAKLQGDWEKADKAVISAEEKRDYIRFLIGKQKHVIERLRVDVTITCAAPEPQVVVNGDTGEVIEKGPAERQKLMVYALRPGKSEPVAVEVGDRTRFGELVADYLSELGVDEDLEAFSVTGDDGIDRPLKSVIGLDDYDREFTIERVAAG